MVNKVPWDRLFSCSSVFPSVSFHQYLSSSSHYYYQKYNWSKTGNLLKTKNNALSGVWKQWREKYSDSFFPPEQTSKVNVKLEVQVQPGHVSGRTFPTNMLCTACEHNMPWDCKLLWQEELRLQLY
jgi:hypothetical protein